MGRKEELLKSATKAAQQKLKSKWQDLVAQLKTDNPLSSPPYVHSRKKTVASGSVFVHGRQPMGKNQHMKNRYAANTHSIKTKSGATLVRIGCLNVMDASTDISGAVFLTCTRTAANQLTYRSLAIVLKSINENDQKSTPTLQQNFFTLSLVTSFFTTLFLVSCGSFAELSFSRGNILNYFKSFSFQTGNLYTDVAQKQCK